MQNPYVDNVLRTVSELHTWRIFEIALLLFFSYLRYWFQFSNRCFYKRRSFLQLYSRFEVFLDK